MSVVSVSQYPNLKIVFINGDIGDAVATFLLSTLVLIYVAGSYYSMGNLEFTCMFYHIRSCSRCVIHAKPVGEKRKISRWFIKIAFREARVQKCTIHALKQDPKYSAAPQYCTVRYGRLP
jgi:hypothetical protein